MAPKSSRLAEAEEFDFAPVEKLGRQTFNTTYIRRHIELILRHRLVDVKAIKKAKFKIAVDAVNSTGGIAVPQLLKELGVKVTEINCEPTGKFAHNPEPLPENITEISSVVKRSKLDLGIVVDPDVDRLAFVQEDGVPFGEEYTLVAIADYVLTRRKGNTVSNLFRPCTPRRNGEDRRKIYRCRRGRGECCYSHERNKVGDWR